MIGTEEKVQHASDEEHYSEEETVARREAALKRMLSTPHMPHKPSVATGKPHKAEAPVRAKRKPQTDSVKDASKPQPARKPMAEFGKRSEVKDSHDRFANATARKPKAAKGK